LGRDQGKIGADTYTTRRRREKSWSPVGTKFVSGDILLDWTFGAKGSEEASRSFPS
jgi:hypothetical protein